MLEAFEMVAQALIVLRQVEGFRFGGGLLIVQQAQLHDPAVTKNSRDRAVRERDHAEPDDGFVFPGQRR